jgi:glycosyltransferase involved in cell wall biosynthesis
VKNEIIRRYGVPAERITVIHNGVDTGRFRPLRKRKTNTAIVVGDNPKLKNIDKAKEYCRKRKMKLLVVGIDGTNTDMVEYFGKVPNEKMPELYKKADLLLFFSKVEGHPLAPLEALACGLDVIASRESNIEIFPKLMDGSYMIKGRDARKTIMKYDWKKQAERYREVYELVIGR